MKILELFAGTKSVSRVFASRGHETFTVEWDRRHPDIDLYADIGTLTAEDILSRFGRPDVVWASPDCATYSVAAISHHRNGVEPKTEYARFCDAVNAHFLDLIRELRPRFYFIENPAGMLQHMPFLKDFLAETGGAKHLLTYCKYSDPWTDECGVVHLPRQKRTHIFTNHQEPRFLPPCRNGDTCHEKAPRGARTGTQGLKGSVERSRIPERLCEHICDICEESLCRKTDGGNERTTDAKLVEIFDAVLYELRGFMQELPDLETPELRDLVEEAQAALDELRNP